MTSHKTIFAASAAVSVVGFTSLHMVADPLLFAVCSVPLTGLVLYAPLVLVETFRERVRRLTERSLDLEGVRWDDDGTFVSRCDPEHAEVLIRLAEDLGLRRPLA